MKPHEDEILDPADGVINLYKEDISEEDIAEFKRQWVAKVSGETYETA